MIINKDCLEALKILPDNSIDFHVNGVYGILGLWINTIAKLLKTKMVAGFGLAQIMGQVTEKSELKTRSITHIGTFTNITKGLFQMVYTSTTCVGTGRVVIQNIWNQLLERSMLIEALQRNLTLLKLTA